MYLGGWRPLYTLYEHVRTNMLVALPTNLLSERMKDGGFNALQLIGEVDFLYIQQPRQLREADASGDINVNLLLTPP